MKWIRKTIRIFTLRWRFTSVIPLSMFDTQDFSDAERQILNQFFKSFVGKKVLQKLYASVIEISFSRDRNITPELEGVRKGMLLALYGLQELAGLNTVESGLTAADENTESDYSGP